MPFPIILLAILVLLCFAVLLGCSWTDSKYDQRSRRQAALQRQLNTEWEALQLARQEIPSDERRTRRDHEFL